MALPQDISPVNSEAMESLVRSNQMDWVPQTFDPVRSFMKVLWTGPESGRVALLFRCLAGAVLFFDDQQFLGYQGWEEFHRVRQQQHTPLANGPAASPAATPVSTPP